MARSPTKMTARQFELLSRCGGAGSVALRDWHSVTVLSCLKAGWIVKAGAVGSEVLRITDKGRGAMVLRSVRPKDENANRPNRSQMLGEIRRARDCIRVLMRNGYINDRAGDSVYTTAMDGLKAFYENTARVG